MTSYNVDIRDDYDYDVEQPRGRSDFSNQPYSKHGCSHGSLSRPNTPSSRASTHSRRSLSVSPEPSPTRNPLNPTLDNNAVEANVAPIMPPETLPSEPPDYWDATHVDSTSAHQPPQSYPAPLDSYGTVGTQVPFRSGEEPEAMADASQPLLGQNINTKERKGRLARCCTFNGNRVGKCLVLFCMILIVVGFIVEVALKVRPKHKTDPDSTLPGEGNGSYRGPSECPSATYNTSETFSFNQLNNFTFLEFERDTSDSLSDIPVHTSGHVLVRRARSHQESDVRVDVLVHYTSSTILSHLQFNKKDDESLEVTPPSHVAYENPGSSSGGLESHDRQPCTIIYATIWLNRGVSFDALRISSTHLAIRFLNDLQLSTSVLDLQSHTGGVIFPSLPVPIPHDSSFSLLARDILIDSTAGVVRGTYPLYDSLTIRSTSGSIVTSVEPKPADKKVPKPGRLDISSVAGSVRVTYPSPSAYAHDHDDTAKALEGRDWITNVRTRAGSMRLHDILIGSATVMQSDAGRLEAVLVPASDRNVSSHISTTSAMGSTHVGIKKHLFEPKGELRKLSGSHRAGAGSMTLTYPTTWEGTLEGSVLAGSLSIHWPGMDYHEEKEQDSGFLNKHIYGTKGNGTGKVSFKGNAGSVKLISKNLDS